MKRHNVLIAGAGIGGLTAAASLLKAGHDVTLFEQASELSEIGAGLQLSANATHVLHHLGLGPALAEVGVRPGAYVFRLHDTGEEIHRFALSNEHEKLHGAPYYQVHRADIHNLLAAKVLELKRDAVRLNSRVIGFEESDDGVKLRLADGPKIQGDLLVGADGLKSVICQQIVGNVPATYTGDAAWRITVPVERLPRNFMEQVMMVWMGPGRHVVAYYLRAGALLNFVGLVETDEVSEESWTAKFPWERFKADFEGWHPDVQAIIEAADREGCYRWSLYNRPAIKNWSTPRVTLLGDAVHPTLPYLAQGACMAIEDGAVLTRALDQADSIPDALQLYQRNRVHRTVRIVNQSTANRTLFHLRTVDEIRTSFAKRDEGADRNAWLYSYNPLTVRLV
ncbi:MAG TPA: FAD-dependent monooxygenase [Candidatus Binatia bacterium]|nr:FAD-dependent monooxygenase [Candidatus Binatia bacterium]